MLRTKVTEIGRLRLLDDGGLVCSVTTDELPPLDPSALQASFVWASPGPSDWAIGDLVAHRDHGVARYRGSKSLDTTGAGQIDYLVLEFAEGSELYVPAGRSYLIQKLEGMTCQLSKLSQKSARWPLSYCIEALPNAYEWPGMGAFPEFPEEPQRTVKTRRIELISRGKIRRKEQQQLVSQYADAVTEWRRACAAYQKALHASSSYRQAGLEYFERQKSEPLPLFDWWVYRAVVLRVGTSEPANIRNRDELALLIKQYVLRRERSIERIQREVETLENYEKLESAAREQIPEEVRLFVWRRDRGQCVRCGSRDRLEFDHIIPVIAGGSNTERNVQLLCESCNRSKGATV